MYTTLNQIRECSPCESGWKKLHDLTETYEAAKQEERLAKTRALLARSKIAKRDAEEDAEFWNKKATMLWTMINSPVMAVR